MDFLAENNYCGQTLLKLVSRGNSTIAELLRLKDVIPSIYKDPSIQEKSKYGELLTLDLSYFSGSNDENFEKSLESKEALKSLDEELKETHVDLLTRFYKLFENIHRYANDFIHYLNELEEGRFIQNSLESVFLDSDGKQLLSEALHLYGVMLLSLDNHIEGHVREKLLVAYYRYSGAQESNESKIEDIVQLLRSTGFQKSQTKRVAKYPESFFKRMVIPEHFVRMVIGRLRSDDIYNQARCYPNPEHRCTAFSEQASMLFVCLFFAPTILESEASTMREIVDKFFPDNWILSVYMGSIFNLVDWWEPYKAAKAALNNTIVVSNIKPVVAKNVTKLQKLLPDTEKLLQEGALTEENLLDSSVKVLNLIRECNVTLRWLMLHTSKLSPTSESHKKCRQLRDLVNNETKTRHGHIFQLLLNTSQFEYKLITMYKKMINRRARQWEKCREKARGKMTDLIKLLENETKNRKASKLRDWFVAREAQMAQLSLDDSLFSGNLARQLLDALHEAQDMDQFEANWAIKQHVEEAKDYLRQMIRTAGLRDDDLVTLQLVGDLSYAWEIIDSFTMDMQEGVKRDPSLVGKLRATFLKLASAMERPVLRISQARSKDLISVSQYYSTELVSYVRNVLQIIPETMFRLLDQIIKLQTQKIKDVPTRLDKDKIKEFAQLNERYEVAKLTHSISVFTEGILAMKSTLYGVIKVDPKQLLEDGIRKELVRLLTMTLHNGLTGPKKKVPNELFTRLESLKKTMNGLRVSFQYIQDYVNIPGLRIWQEELSRIFNFYVEQESNAYLKQKVMPWNSLYQSKTIVIPLVIDDGSTFMGKLVSDLVSFLSPKSTIFVPNRQSWYDYKTQTELCGLTQLFGLLQSAIGTFGMVGLDRLLGLQITTLIQKLVAMMDVTIFKDKSWIELLDNFSNSLNPIENVIAQPWKFYHQQHLSRASRALNTLIEMMGDLGQLQLLRQCLAYQLATTANFDSKLLLSSLKTFNSMVVNHFARSHQSQDGGSESESRLLYELGFFLSNCGLSEPTEQVYCSAKPAPKLSELLFLAVIGQLSKCNYSSEIEDLLSKKLQDHVDSHAFILGMTCLLKQYPDTITRGILEYLAQYARSFIAEHSSTNAKDTPMQVQQTMVFLQHLKNVKPQDFEDVVIDNFPPVITALK